MAMWAHRVAFVLGPFWLVLAAFPVVGVV